MSTKYDALAVFLLGMMLSPSDLNKTKHNFRSATRTRTFKLPIITTSPAVIPISTMSATPPLEGSSSKPVNRHALTAVERQRSHLEKLLKDPAKPAYVPPPPKEKIIRPAREMMKNVQGSSAGAGSGEFHVYKASRRREYERLKLLDETAQKVCRVYQTSLLVVISLPGI